MPCLDDDTVWQLVQGELAVAAMARAEAHLDGCGDCRAVVATVARGSRPDGDDGGADAAGDADVLALAPGARLGRYVVGERLGSGAMGVVYAAWDPHLDRRVALKVLRDDGDAADAARPRLQREAQAMAKLADPHVVAVHEVGTAGGRVYVAMELVAGATLRAWAPARSWRQVCDVLVQAGRGLAAAHAAGLIHRDVKPDNVIVGDDGRARIGDFGLARGAGVDGAAAAGADGGGADVAVVDDDGAAAVTLTRTGVVVGTPAYMAPEVLRGGAADARADQFGFCVTAFEALHGVRPYAGASWQALLASIDAGAITRGPGAVPAWLDAILARGLAASPASRWPSLTALLDAIDARRHRRRHAWAWAGGAALAASAVTAAVVVAATGAAPAAAPRCDTGAAQLATVWDADARARSPRRWARSTGRGVGARRRRAHGRRARRLDRAVGGRPGRAVPGHHRHPRGGADAAATRGRCFERRRDELAALVARLETADRAIALRAVDAVAALPEPAECAALAAGAADPLPAEPAQRAAAVDAQRRIATARAALAVGDHARALADSAPLIADAEASGHAPTVAEAQLVRAAALRAAGDLRAAEDPALASLWAAERGHDDVGAAQAWLELVSLAGERRDLDEAEVRARHADAAIARAGAPEALAARLELARG
ncbi:MAG: serine/threonine protein kinase [Kofleriaceae bacterium]|nr:serine/threonine protein kinase [Kofleriaceae bacterium]